MVIQILFFFIYDYCVNFATMLLRKESPLFWGWVKLQNTNNYINVPRKLFGANFLIRWKYYFFHRKSLGLIYIQLLCGTYYVYICWSIPYPLGFYNISTLFYSWANDGSVTLHLPFSHHHRGGGGLNRICF